VALYWTAVAASLAVSLPVAWSPLAVRIDNSASDWLMRLHSRGAWPPETVIVAIDDASFQSLGGVRGLRGALSEALLRIAAAKPKVVAVDVILADAGDPREDARLAAALGAVKPLVLSCELLREGWQDPIPSFRLHASAVGHVHADPDPLDGISRTIPLERASARDRRWALALEAFRLSRGVDQVEESPNDLSLASLIIPSRREGGRLLRIRYLPPEEDETSRIPRVSLRELLAGPAAAASLSGKVVFVGATAQSALRDRLMTPYSLRMPMPGVEIHTHVYETFAWASRNHGRFLTEASNSGVVLLCVMLAAAAGAIFYFLAGWPAYVLATALLAAAHAAPHLALRQDVIFPYFAPVATAWLAVTAAAVYQYFTVRRTLRRTEGERARYQQAIRFVTHEMRTPLTAIQGSSELMGRYNLSEEKRKQMAAMINAESKRLAQMIRTFLDVEKLGEGQMELKRELFGVRALVDVCLERIRPVAERKGISVTPGPMPAATMVGDRELMEYAVYNLLTNAVKYSPAGTQVEIMGAPEGTQLRLSVRDQGMGMDDSELKRIFTKFYRTRRAEASGEAGTGIGLSIVDQIVNQHGGKMEVTSAPGRGSCFTMILPVKEMETCNASS
jgi:signal transduction histidine kinase